MDYFEMKTSLDQAVENHCKNCRRANAFQMAFLTLALIAAVAIAVIALHIFTGKAACAATVLHSSATFDGKQLTVPTAGRVHVYVTQSEAIFINSFE